MRVTSSALIIAAAIMIGFALSIPHTSEVEQKIEVEAVVAPTIPVVTILDSYKKGTHTITGSLLLPNACTTLSSEATAQTSASTTEAIVVALTTSSDTGVCLQIPTVKKFSTTVSAPAEVPIQVLVNGSVASTSPQ